MSSLDDVTAKITAGTVTTVDLDNLIAEARAANAVERVQRRTRRTPEDPHIDPEGHQPLALPNLDARVVPRPANDSDEQMDHRGEAGHRHSEREQRQHALATEAAWLCAQHGKPLTEALATAKPAGVNLVNASRLAKALLRRGEGDQNWLYALIQEIDRA